MRSSGVSRGNPGDVAVALRDLHPGFCEVTERLFGRSLSPQWLSPTRFAAVTLALDALVTQLDVERLRASLDAAREELDDDQILTVLEIVSVAGLHSVSMAAPIVLEECVSWSGAEVTLSPAAEASKEAFERSGPRPRPVDGMYGAILALDVDYFEAFRNWIDHPWKSGVLDHGSLHLVCIAIDVACTHLHEPGLRRHLQEAFKCDVTVHEALEVVQMASMEGLRTVFAGVHAGF